MRVPVRRWVASLVARTSSVDVVWATFFVGLVVRLWFVHVHPLGENVTSDMQVYDTRAGHLFERAADAMDAFTPVGYPAYLALIYRGLGRAYETIGALNALMGGVTAALANLVARRVSGSSVVAVVVGLGVALYPPLILYSGFLLTETPSAFLLTLTVWLVLRAADDEGPIRAALAGLVFAAAVSVRPNFLLGLPAIAWFVWVWVARDRRRATAFAGRFLAGALPLLFAVCLHNSRILGKPAGLGANGGLNFYLAHAHVSGAAFRDAGGTHRIVPIPNLLRYRGAPEFTSPVPLYDERFFYRRGVAEFTSRPRELLDALDNVVEGVGLGEQGFWPGSRAHDAFLQWVARGFAVLVIVPAVLWGAVLEWRGSFGSRENAGRALLWGLALSALATLYLFLGDPRVRVPLDPMFMVLAADAWARVARLGFHRIKANE